MNSVTLVGNLTADPEVRTVREGRQVANFRVASNTRKDQTTFISCEAFGKTAEFVAKWFTKGKPIFVTGELRQDSWEDPSGNRRERLVVTVSNAAFVPGGKGGEARPQGAQARPDEAGEEEIPF